MDRQACVKAWWRYYAMLEPEDRQGIAEGHVGSLEGRMRELACFPQRICRGFSTRALQIALGMALGIHKQILWGLTSAPWGATLKGGGGAWPKNQSQARPGYNAGALSHGASLKRTVKADVSAGVRSKLF